MWKQCHQLSSDKVSALFVDSGTIQSSLFPEARDVGGLERDSSAATGVPGLVWVAVFTPDLGVAWDIEARHKLRSLRRCEP